MTSLGWIPLTEFFRKLLDFNPFLTRRNLLLGNVLAYPGLKTKLMIKNNQEARIENM
jgi:hypothetical protein